MAIVGLVALALLAAACGGGGDDGDSAATGTTNGGGNGSGSAVTTDTVDIEGFQFQPAEITVAAGTTVTWTNKDGFAHTVKDDSGLFDESENLDEGDSFSFTYDAPGTYRYICGIHNSMIGTVVVT